jgi:hypothetical protein
MGLSGRCEGAVMKKNGRLEFKEWLSEVNTITLARHHMSIYELEDDIPRTVMKLAYDKGTTPERFVESEVDKIFRLEDETDV